ncbi:unnamed protein product, partial [Prorocentrum cordatum]
MAVLRLSIAAYRLARCIATHGVCSVLLLATRGIMVGSVHATIELGLLRRAVITVYVDNTSFEASVSEQMVCDTVVGAARHFTESLVKVGMVFSPTKNMVFASRRELAVRIVSQHRGLRLKVVDMAKSLGGAISSGRFRNAALLTKRLQAFNARKPQFQKLRRWVGAQRTAAVLQTGGAVALVHGHANTGVANSTLQAQSAAVAAASVPCGSGELDMTLILADGSMRSKAPSCAEARADRGQHVDFAMDSLAMAHPFVQQSIWHGLFMQPIFKLRSGKDGGNWGPAEKSALRSARQRMDPEGVLSLSSPDLDLPTRGTAPSSASSVDPPPEQETFEWVVPHGPLAAQVDEHVDGPRVDGEADLHVGIHAAELLLKAVQSIDPAAHLKVDCSAVQLGAQRDLRWATVPGQAFARAWGPILVPLESNPDWVMRTQAQNTVTNDVSKKMSNGRLAQASDVAGNDLVDDLAKQAARRDAVPQAQVQLVRAAAARLRDAAA